MKISTRDVKLAEIRYFNVERNGLELTPPISHVMLLNRGDTYINLLNCGEFQPVYRRNKRKTNIYNDEYIGTKIELVCGNVQDGEAWLLTDTNFSEVFGCDEVDMDTIERYVLESKLFFKDRLELVSCFDRRYGLSIFTIRDIVRRDEKSHEEMRAFFSEREQQKVMKK